MGFIFNKTSNNQRNTDELYENKNNQIQTVPASPQTSRPAAKSRVVQPRFLAIAPDEFISVISIQTVSHSQASLPTSYTQITKILVRRLFMAGGQDGGQAGVSPPPLGLLAAGRRRRGRGAVGGRRSGRDRAAAVEARGVVRVREVDGHLQDLVDVDEVRVRDVVELGDVADARVEEARDLAEGVALDHRQGDCAVGVVDGATAGRGRARQRRGRRRGLSSRRGRLRRGGRLAGVEHVREAAGDEAPGLGLEVGGVCCGRGLREA